MDDVLESLRCWDKGFCRRWELGQTLDPPDISICASSGFFSPAVVLQVGSRRHPFSPLQCACRGGRPRSR